MVHVFSITPLFEDDEPIAIKVIVPPPLENYYGLLKVNGVNAEYVTYEHKRAQLLTYMFVKSEEVDDLIQRCIDNHDYDGICWVLDNINNWEGYDEVSLDLEKDIAIYG